LNFIKKCGVLVEPQEGMSVEELIGIALRMEKLGFGYFFRSDHILPTSRRRAIDASECWVTLGALAARTKAVNFGPLVSPIGFRNPAILARMARTVASYSGNRLQLGVGAGWFGEEFLAHGLDFPPFKVRHEQFREALEIIRRFTQGERVDFDGRYFSAHLESQPKPNEKIRMILGGRSRQVIQKAAVYADEWNGFSLKPERVKDIKLSLSSEGREVEISRVSPFIIAENRRKLGEKVRARIRKERARNGEEWYIRELRSAGWLVETQEGLCERVNQFRDVGVDKLYFQILDPGDKESTELVADVLRRV